MIDCEVFPKRIDCLLYGVWGEEGMGEFSKTHFMA